MRLSDIIIVLSRPAEPGNVGAVCRAMKNMGLSRLRLAAPEFDETAQGTGEQYIRVSCAAPPLDARQAEAEESALPPRGGLADGQVLSEAGFGYGGNEAIIRARAIHAADIWEKSETFDSLSAAVKDCALVVGTTRRRGRRRKQVSMTPAELALFLRDRPGKAALVFGSERTGLEDGELEICHLASHIPVNEDFPSLNLSHAVQIYAYELFNALGAREEHSVKGQWIPLDGEAVEAFAGGICDKLRLIGFYKQVSGEDQKRFFRDVFSRAALTEREGRYFSDIIAKAARLASDAGKKLPSASCDPVEDQEKLIAEIRKDTEKFKGVL